MNALAHVLEHAARMWPELAPSVEPGFAEPPKPAETPDYLVEATPCAWFACHCHLAEL
jgi:hypothetical protein